MKTIYEVYQDGLEIDESGKKIKEYKETTKIKSTHTHYCMHDEGESCRRVKK